MEKKVQQSTIELMGTNYEIGHTLGQLSQNTAPLLGTFPQGPPPLPQGDLAAVRALFAEWCPGLNEEIQGFADGLDVSSDTVTFYAMTYLQPRCSQAVLLPPKTANGHTLLMRNYEFSDTAEDFTLMRTSVKGRFSHLGTSVLQFGRDEGLNEAGLAVSMSSCGFPVGAMATMRNPAIRGLQFWAVIRSVLERCCDVKEALYLLKHMPIAYNLNLLLADKNGHCALFETLDGQKAQREMGTETGEGYLCATNHALLSPLKETEPRAMRHSVIRYEFLKDYLDHSEKVSEEDLKTLLLRKFPHGPTCFYYNDFFGTTKSILMDVTASTMELCWGGLAKNGWQRYDVSKSLVNRMREITLHCEQADSGIYEFIDVK